jgi:hypothetical protein
MAHVTGLRLTILAVSALSLPQAASARDVEICANLYRELSNAPQIVGTGGDMRRYAAEVSQQNADIRNLRIDMRNQGCRPRLGGSGSSIVTLGRSTDPVCHQMQEALDALEAQRKALAEQRNSSRSLSQPSEERVAILAAIRQNNCTPADLDAQTSIDEQERMRIRGIALPGPDTNSSITHLGKPVAMVPKEEKIELPPERPYDPSRKVRMVGPRFFPERKIDLANPKLVGPQPQQ